jgi:uncharacterized membrane protein
VAGAIFLGLDSVWIMTTSGLLYRPLLGDLLRDGFDLGPAAAFYLLYVAGVVTFAVLPAIADERVTVAFSRGARFGLVAYATYDLTNQATLRGWPWTITIADLCWGTLATGLAAAATCAVLRRWRALRASIVTPGPGSADSG